MRTMNSKIPEGFHKFKQWLQFFFVTVTQIVSCVIIGGGFIRLWCETHVQAHVGPTSSYANRDAFSLQQALLPLTLLVLGFLKESDSRMQLQV